MNTRIIFPRAWKQFLWVNILKFFEADPEWKKSGSGMEKIRIRNPGWEKIGSEMNIPEPQHCKKIFLITFP
jgi:hypothetical protein